MTPFEPRPRRRALIPLLVTVVGLTLGAGGFGVLRPLGAAAPARPEGTGAARGAGAGASGGVTASLSPKAVYARVEPSVVDVTATLRYESETASGTGFVIAPRTATPRTATARTSTARTSTARTAAARTAGPRSVFVLTNNHVLRGATSVVVTVPGTGQSYRAAIVGVDVTADVAVLRIGPVPGLAQAPIGDSAIVGVGARVVAIGNQAGAGGSPALASGLISGTGKTIQAADAAAGFSETLHGMLATTAKIKPGDSGGPLADAAGAVIGIDTAAGTDGAAPGYAIPINAAMTAARQITAGRPGPGIILGTGGFLGIVVRPAPAPGPGARAARERHRRTARTQPPGYCLATLADSQTPAQAAPARSGALVDGVLCGTVAATAGIRAGDVITEAAGRPVASPGALRAILRGSRPGSVVPVTWVSPAGATRTARVRLGPAPAA